MPAGEEMFKYHGYSGPCHVQVKSLKPQPSSTDIVGHKTFATGRTTADGFPELRHEPLNRAEADEIVAEVERIRAKRAADMPTERDAIMALFEAWQRLCELGWCNAENCPKDGSVFQAIEAGSTGIHECSYEGKWPDGHWWIHADGDLCPSRPILFKPAALEGAATKGQGQ
jgi:hypothetical protein